MLRQLKETAKVTETEDDNDFGVKNIVTLSGTDKQIDTNNLIAKIRYLDQNDESRMSNDLSESLPVHDSD